MFEIVLDGEQIVIEGERVQPASIVIDNYTESLYLPLSYWSADDYKKAWLASLREGLARKDHAALAVSMYEPDQTNFIFTWVLYFEGMDVYLHNNMVFLDECRGFTVEQINKFVEPRTTHNDEGMKISEWRTDLKSVIDFYHHLEA
ncbi:hypothetical protein [Pantoea sp. Ae16]|uniref:hypothetical protein n=1 Tax=Pantoea sp. Ae16 TaxID=1890373 RepID=UPI0008FD90C8|nr:hypothetical protein [Pantoea sp. Ae16]OIX90642.1 hypothetical protein BFS13_10715 [Pantoea sp. Ae16]